MMIEITDGNAHLTIENIEVLERPSLAGEYDWSDGVAMTIQTKVRRFQAVFDEVMYLGELHGFHQDLQRLYTELKGGACLKVMEGFLELTAEINSQGHIHWSVRLADTSGSANMARLMFEMHADQSYLPALLAQIEAVLEMFPVKGQP